MAERSSKAGLRWAAGLALAAVGATALYDRLQVRGPTHSGADPAYGTDFSTGRGTPNGAVDVDSRKAGYELVDTNVRALAIIMLVSILIMAGGVTSVFFMFRSFDRHFIAQSAADTPEQRAAIVPPEPHLQVAPYHEIDATLMEQTQRLTTYGWTDAAHRRAHIPVHRAMDLVVGKTLDAWASADPDSATSSLPSVAAPMPQAKPANAVQGEGRPGAVAPSYDPAAATK